MGKASWSFFVKVLVVFLSVASSARAQSCDLSGGSWKGSTDVLEGYPNVVSSTDTYYFDDDSSDAEGYTTDAYDYVYYALDGTLGDIGSYRAYSEVMIIDDTGVDACNVTLTSYGVYSLSQDDVLVLYATDCEIDTCPDACAAYCFDGCWQDAADTQPPPRTNDVTFDDTCDSFTLQGGTTFTHSSNDWWIVLIVVLSLVIVCVVVCVIIGIVACVIKNRNDKKKKEDQRRRAQNEPDAFNPPQQIQMQEQDTEY